MNKITIDEIRQKAKPGDILIGQYHITDLAVSPILLIGDCVSCFIDKPNVLDNTNRYIERLKGGVYQEYLVVKGDYMVGQKIRIISMNDIFADYKGKEGVIEHIDSLGQLHGTWGCCAVIPGVDSFEVVEDVD